MKTNNKAKVVIFGTGQFYFNRKKEYCFSKVEIVAFLDNDEKKQGEKIDGVTIYSPADIGRITYDYLIIMVKANDGIREQLLEYGVDRSSILSYSEFVEMHLDTLTLGEECTSEEKNYLCEKKPSVSVVIPNYNYAMYLPERIREIASQTYSPFEIIFLDDCSTDNSVEVAKRELEKYKIPYRVLPNEKNAGCFRQWIHGVREARGEFVWIAEADDMCQLNFLERVVPKFADDEVNLAYAQSEVIDENGVHSGWIYTEYTNQLDEEKWKDDYVNDGKAEILNNLAIMNTIPNASGVVFRKTALDGIDEALCNYSMAGDWFAYIYALRNGKIAFISQVLNFHRRHSSSIISKQEKNVKFIVEQLNIKKYLSENYVIPVRIIDKFCNHVLNEYKRLYGSDWHEEAEICELVDVIEQNIHNNLERYTFAHNVPRKRILFVIPDFEMGGGQTLIIRLANYVSRYHNAYMYCAQPNKYEERVRKMVSPNVKVLKSLGTPEDLKEQIKREDIQIVNSHIWWADKITYKALELMPQNDVKHLLCMHGCYEMLIHHPEVDGEFSQLYKKILTRANHIICGSTKNKEIFDYVEVPSDKISIVHYGYEHQNVPAKLLESENISKDAFVVGLVARGIKEKGFEEAIQAVKQVRAMGANIELVLVGNGPFIDELIGKYSTLHFVHFINDLKKPSEWIGWVKVFDVGLLPTYFVSETLPNTVIEYLAYELPVISTNIGDIREMILSEKGDAGILLELDNGGVNIDELASAVYKLYSDKKLYKEMKKNTKLLFEQFEMKNFVESYYVKMQ